MLHQWCRCCGHRRQHHVLHHWSECQQEMVRCALQELVRCAPPRSRCCDQGTGCCGEHYHQRTCCESPAGDDAMYSTAGARAAIKARAGAVNSHHWRPCCGHYRRWCVVLHRWRTCCDQGTSWCGELHHGACAAIAAGAGVNTSTPGARAAITAGANAICSITGARAAITAGARDVLHHWSRRCEYSRSRRDVLDHKSRYHCRCWYVVHHHGASTALAAGAGAVNATTGAGAAK